MQLSGGHCDPMEALPQYQIMLLNAWRTDSLLLVAIAAVLLK